VGIGTSIFLIAVGAILTFALDISAGGVDLDVVGWILMGAGVLGLVIFAMLWGNRRRAVVSDEPVEYRRVRQVGTTEPTEYRRVEERREVGPPW
jgi:hypothetical protein